MTIYLGSIKVEHIKEEGKPSFIRLTVDTEPFLNEELDQMEAEGETIADALLTLHEQVEEILR